MSDHTESNKPPVEVTWPGVSEAFLKLPYKHAPTVSGYTPTARLLLESDSFTPYILAFARAILGADAERRLGMLAYVPMDRCPFCESKRNIYWGFNGWSLAHPVTHIFLAEIVFCPDCGERLPEVKS